MGTKRSGFRVLVVVVSLAVVALTAPAAAQTSAPGGTKTLYIIGGYETKGESSQAVPNYDDGAKLAVQDLTKKGWTVKYERTPASGTVASSQEQAFLAAQAKNPDFWIGLTSSFETVDGTSHEMADVWFRVGEQQQGADLRSKVSGMAQSIAAFGAEPTAVAPAGQLQLPNASGTPTLAVSTASMADALKRFDQAGAGFGGNTMAAAATGTPKAPGQNDADKGYLASK